jgi:hypothetical protein
LKKLPQVEESRKLFMSRPSLAYLGLSSDEDPGACADKMQVSLVGNSNMRFCSFIQGGLGKLEEDQQIWCWPGPTEFDCAEL